RRPAADRGAVCRHGRRAVSRRRPGARSGGHRRSRRGADGRRAGPDRDGESGPGRRRRPGRRPNRRGGPGAGPDSSVTGVTPRNPSTPRLALLYGLLALLSFPTLETILSGTRGIGYKLDVFDLAGGVPRIAATVNEWSRYGISWWDPYFGTGNDILAQHSIAPIAPDVALGVVVGPFLAYAITAWLMAVVAGLGMHLFLRDVLRLPLVPCLIGSVVFLFGFWHYIYGFAGPGIPVGLWLADRAIRPGPRRWLAIAGWIAF